MIPSTLGIAIAGHAVIGSLRMFGFDVPPNTYRPLIAQRVLDFWNRLSAATEAFEHILSFANDVGLYAEEIDVATGAAIGNFPQAFTHVGLINAAMALTEAQKGSRR